MGTYLVTGAAGFVGSHLSESLIADGHDVVGIDYFSDYYDVEWKRRNVRAIGDAGFRLVEDHLATTDLDALLEGVDGVYHLAAQAGVRASWGSAFEIYLRDNLHSTQRLFDAAAGRGVRVVWASSSSVYGDAAAYPTAEDTRPAPISPYGITKLGCEHLQVAFQKSAGLDAIALRYFTVYGPRQRPDMAFTRIALALLDGAQFTMFGDGHQSRDVTYVGDAVSGTRAAMERGRAGSIYNIGGGAETTLNEVIGILEELSGATLDVRRIEQAAGDVRRTVSDTSRLRGDTGWEAQTSTRDGLSHQLEWAREVHGGAL